MSLLKIVTPLLKSLFYIRLSKRKNRFLFDYRILNIMVSSVHHRHTARKYT